MKRNEDILKTVFLEIDKLKEEQILFLKTLVKDQSLLLNEKNAQLHVARKMGDLGLDLDVFDIDIGRIYNKRGFSPVEWTYFNRPQVVGIWKSDKKIGSSLTINGHIDVVSAEPEYFWTKDPWDPEIENNYFYGRGSGDMKSGIAAMIYAVEALKKCGVKITSDLILQSVIEEECTGNGTLACLEKGYLTDAALIIEPTNEKILNAQLGILWMRVKVLGKGGHVDKNDSPVNAIEKAYTIINYLKELEKVWNNNKNNIFLDAKDPINFNVGKIQGGDWPSNTPSECIFEMRLSFYPGKKPEEVKKEILDFIRNRIKSDNWLSNNPPIISWYGHHDEGCVIDKNWAFIKELEKIHRDINNKEPEYINVNACTDVRFWRLNYNIPATCYGVYGYNLHAADEHVDIRSMNRVTKFIAQLIIEWCGISI